MRIRRLSAAGGPLAVAGRTAAVAGRTAAVAGGTLAVAGLIAATPALAAGTTVSVRVEGVKRTLLQARTVTTHSGWITKGHTPRGACPAAGAAGALDVATRHRWGGSYESFGLGVTSIFGESHPLTAKSKYYWSVWVNNRYAPAGICDLKLHRGEQLLFAAVPQTGNPLPIVVKAPRHAVAGHPFTVRVSYIDAKGRSRPLAGAAVTRHAATSQRGAATVTLTRAGRDVVRVSRAGYIRAEATVTVTRS